MMNKNNEKTVRYTNKDNLILEGTMGTVANPKGTILMSHGLDTDRNENGFYNDIAELLYSINYNAFRFDLRAHGNSQGELQKITISDLVNDMSELIDYLYDLNTLKITIISASFSGGVGLFSANKRPEIIGSVILLNPVLDYHYQYITKKDFWIKGEIEPNTNKYLMRNGFIMHGSFPIGMDMIKDLPNYDKKNIPRSTIFPVLTIHGGKDSKVPYEIAYQYRNYNKDSKFVDVKGSEHGFRNPINQRPYVLHAIKDWLINLD